MLELPNAIIIHFTNLAMLSPSAKQIAAIGRKYLVT